MPSATLRKLHKQALECAVNIAWAQWGTVAGFVSRSIRVQSIIDPEALLLASLYLGSHEARLRRVTAWWAARGARLLSVQRLRNISSHYPSPVHRSMAEFALMAVEDGRDLRWRSIAGKARPKPARSKDLEATPTLTEPPTLLLRLRLGFGVGIKADVLTFLLGRAGARATIRQIATSTGYYERAVRRAVEEMAAARLLVPARTAPASYSANPDAWSSVLELPGDPPLWRYWNENYSFVINLLEWFAAGKDASPYLMSSRARDLMETHGSVLDLHGIDNPMPEDFPGEAYLDPFVETAFKLIERLSEIA
jgi:hypothetical protein